MKSSETLEPPVGSSEFRNAESLGDRFRFFLQRRTIDESTGFLLKAIPFPDEAIDLFITRPPSSSFPQSNSRTAFAVGLFFPLFQISVALVQNIENLRLSAPEFVG